jgi:hypothetical protein
MVQYGNTNAKSPYCGKKVQITTVHAPKKSVVATVSVLARSANITIGSRWLRIKGTLCHRLRTPARLATTPIRSISLWVRSRNWLASIRASVSANVWTEKKGVTELNHVGVQYRSLGSSSEIFVILFGHGFLPSRIYLAIGFWSSFPAERDVEEPFCIVGVFSSV